MLIAVALKMDVPFLPPLDRQTIRLTLPVPPTTNNLYFNTGRRRAKSEEYLQWIADADISLMQQKRGLLRLGGPLALMIRIPRRVRGDVSNRIKAAEDFLVSRGVTGDDRKNEFVSIWRTDVEQYEIEIRELT